MSTIEVLKVYQPMLDMPNRAFLCPIGPASSNYQVVKSLNASTSQAVWSTITPGVSCGVNRKMWLRYTIQATYPAGVVDANCPLLTTLSNDNFGLRQYPIASTIEAATLKLNGSSVSVQLAEIIHALSKVGLDQESRNYNVGACPTYPDQFPNYADFTTGPPTASLGVWDQLNRNPFAKYGANSTETSRNMALYVVSAVATATDATRVRSFTVQIMEPLLMPPMCYGREDQFALYGIQTIDLLITHSNLKRMFAGLDATVTAPFSGVELTYPQGSPPELLVNYITPPADFQVPAYCVYPFSEINIQKNAIVPLPANPKNYTPWAAEVAPRTATSNSISFTCVPDRIYTFLAINPNDRISSNTSYNVPDTFALISRYSGRFETRGGILAEASAEMLYYLSQRNGVEQTWQQWSRFQGSVLCLSFGPDIPLPLLVSTGSRGSWQYQHDLDVRNVQNQDRDFLHYLVWIASGVFSINDSVCSQSVGFITQEALLQASFADAGSWSEIAGMNGGMSFRGFLKDSWKGLKSVGRVVRNVAKQAADVAGPIAASLAQSGALGPTGTNIASQVAKYAPVVSDVASSLGAGRRRGGRSVGGNMIGGALTGGAEASRRTLSTRARR